MGEEVAAAAAVAEALEELRRARRLTESATGRLMRCSARLLHLRRRTSSPGHQQRRAGRHKDGDDDGDDDNDSCGAHSVLVEIHRTAKATTQRMSRSEDDTMQLQLLGRRWQGSDRRRRRRHRHSRRPPPTARAQLSAAPSQAVALASPPPTPPLQLGVLVLPELQQLLPGRLGVDALGACRGVTPPHLNFLSHTLPLIPSAAAAVAARQGSSAAGLPFTSLSFASLIDGIPENRAAGKCCCAAVRTDGGGPTTVGGAERQGQGDRGAGGVAVVMGMGEAEECVCHLALRVPSPTAAPTSAAAAAGRHWVVPPPFRTPRRHFGVCTCLDGKIVVGGGLDRHGRLLRCYAPLSPPTPPLPAPARRGAPLRQPAISAHVAEMRGVRGRRVGSSVEVYDPDIGRWSTLPPMIAGRACCAALPISVPAAAAAAASNHGLLPDGQDGQPPPRLGLAMIGGFTASGGEGGGDDEPELPFAELFLFGGGGGGSWVALPQ
jgi:hypothetical protein